MRRFDQVRELMHLSSEEQVNYWISKNEIPIGTIYQGKSENLPYYYDYSNGVPLDHVVTIPFDHIKKSMNERGAFNILFLGHSGDGKSLQLKQIWYFLHKAGYYNLYIDPAKTSCGRAKTKWSKSTKYLPPLTKPDRIPLTHYVPLFSIAAVPGLEHNFKKYTGRLSQIKERELWEGLGVGNVGASKIAKIIKSEPNINIKDIIKRLKMLKDRGEIFSQSLTSAMSRLTDVEDYGLVDRTYPCINPMDDWKKGKSVCITYNPNRPTEMTFDIGLRIRQCMDYYNEGNRNPIMLYFDDAFIFAHYTAGKEGRRYNYAVEKIREIGFLSRSMGVYNTLAVQSLSIIDSAVAESYRIKLISPFFPKPDGLADINIPKRAIERLKAEGSDGLVKVKSLHCLQWQLINDDGDAICYFPFVPPVNHFDEVYFPLGEEINVGESQSA